MYALLVFYSCFISLGSFILVLYSFFTRTFLSVCMCDGMACCRRGQLVKHRYTNRLMSVY